MKLNGTAANSKARVQNRLIHALLITLIALLIRYLIYNYLHLDIFDIYNYTKESILTLFSIGGFTFIFNTLFGHLFNTLDINSGNSSLPNVFMTGRGGSGTSTDPIDLTEGPSTTIIDLTRSPTPGPSTNQLESVTRVMEEHMRNKFPNGLGTFLAENPDAKFDMGKLPLSSPPAHTLLDHKCNDDIRKHVTNITENYPNKPIDNYNAVHTELCKITTNVIEQNRVMTNSLGSSDQYIKAQLSSIPSSEVTHQDVNTIKGFMEHLRKLEGYPTHYGPESVFSASKFLENEVLRNSVLLNKTRETLHILEIIAESYPEGSREKLSVLKKIKSYKNSLYVNFAKHQLEVNKLKYLESVSNKDYRYQVIERKKR